MNNPFIELNPFPKKIKKYLKSRKQKNVCFFEHYMKCTSCFSILLVSIVIFFSTTTSAQRFDSILSKLDKEYPQEKLYLQFDRQIYYPGETIWFKAYLFAGNDLSLISKTLYAELIDEKGKVVERKTAPLFESSAAAAFDIPPDIRGQVVYVRAYTKWMINFDSSFTFVKTIPLLNRKTSPGKVVPSQSYLQFFPEGGDLVLNLPSKVAFKGTDEKGQPINIKGSVIDARGKNIVSFKSSHDGMGFFLFQPSLCWSIFRMFYWRPVSTQKNYLK